MTAYDIDELLADRAADVTRTTRRIAAGPARTGAGPYRCGCHPSYGEDCPSCDGTRAERYWRPSDDAVQAIPPCMQSGISTISPRVDAAHNQHGSAA